MRFEHKGVCAGQLRQEASESWQDIFAARWSSAGVWAQPASAKARAN
jgi:hypothetical protein